MDRQERVWILNASATAYFTPGPNGEPPMFGTKESGAFAGEFTPKTSNGIVLLRGNGFYTEHTDRKYLEDGEYREEQYFMPVDPLVVEPACIVAAQAWIRSKGWHVWAHPSGELTIQTDEGDSCPIIQPISGQPDWLGAARWVNEQEK